MSQELPGLILLDFHTDTRASTKQGADAIIQTYTHAKVGCSLNLPTCAPVSNHTTPWVIPQVDELVAMKKNHFSRLLEI